jgi:hypothetical protein
MRESSFWYTPDMRTTVDLSETVLQSAKRIAAERGVTLSVVVEDAVRAQLNRKQSPPAPPFRLHTVRGKLVQPNLDLDRMSALLALEDETEFK